jgi:hypothetical protein
MFYAYNHPMGTVAIAQELKGVPEGLSHVEFTEDPYTLCAGVFRNAWSISGSDLVTDMVKATEIAHGLRREKRTADYAPHDEVIALAIPGNTAAEAAANTARDAIRTADDQFQIDIDAAADDISLVAVLATKGIT